MHAKDNDAVTNYMTEIQALVPPGTPVIFYDASVGNHGRITLIKDTTGGLIYAVYIKDSPLQTDNTFKAELLLDATQ